jgi:phage portal protein BeeE
MGPPGILFEKGIDLTRTALTKPQQKNLEAKLRKMSGTKNANGLAVASGDFGYHNFGLSPVDMLVIEILKYTATDLLNALHLPGQLFNIETQQKYDNMRQARMMAYTDCILPLANRYAEEVTRFLIPRYKDLKGCYLKPVTKDIPELQADRKELAEWTQKVWQLTPNEIREQFGFERIETDEMNQIYIPNSMQPIELSGLNEGVLPTNINL